MPTSANTDRRRLLIVGASARAAAASARRAGLHVAACDLFADRDLAAYGPAQQVEHYPQGLRRWLKDQAAEAKATSHAPLPWLYTGALENHPRLIDAMARVAPLWGCDGRAVRAARDPAIWCETLRQSGVPTVPWLPGEKPSPGQGWLFKPAASGGGAGIRHAEQLTTVTKAGFWQKLQPGEPCAAVYVVGQAHTLLLGLTRQEIGQAWCGASGFQYCGSYGPWRAPLHHAASLRQLLAIGDGLGHLGLRGLVGVDLIATAAGRQGSHQFWPVEINPRYTASVEVLEAALDLRAIALHAAACTGEAFPAAVSFSGGQAAKAILFARRDVTIGETLSDAMMDAAWFSAGSLCTPPGCEIASNVRAGVADIPAPGTFIKRGRPICTLLTWCAGVDEDSEQQLQQSLRQYAADWEAQIYGGAN